MGNKTFTETQILDAFKSNKSKAEEILKDTNKTEDFIKSVEKAIRKLLENNNAKELLNNIILLFNMFKDYAKGKYKEMPIQSVIAIVSALLYVISPMDLIPDSIPVIGYIDDAAVVAFAMKLIKNDIEKYKEWKKKNDFNPFEGL